jgi:hypothetical protein
LKDTSVGGAVMIQLIGGIFYCACFDAAVEQQVVQHTVVALNIEPR